MKKIFLCALVLLLLCSLWGYMELVPKIPDSGVWFCSELEIWLDFDTGYTRAMENNKEIKCIIEGERGTNYINVLNQDFGSTKYNVGEVIFGGTCKIINNEMLEITEYYTEIPYIFILIHDSQ